MAISNNNLSHQFTVSSVDLQTDVDTQINIIKRREEIVYRSSVPADAVNVGFVGGNTISSSTSLSIADRSTSLAANRVQSVSSTTISSAKAFSINTENFVVTDVFTTETETLSALPLYYKHTLNETYVPRDSGGDLDTNVSIMDVQILDHTFSAVKVPELSVDYDTGIIYNNLIPEFASTSDYTVYYVKYTVNNNNTINTYTDLLDNETVYRVAEFNDLTAGMLIKTDGRKVYLIDESFSGYDITLPSISTYAYQPLDASRIEVVPPVAAGVTDSWYVRVTNGTFFTNVNGNLRKYYISEFLSQAFSPEAPTKSVSTEESTIVSKNLIKLDHENIRQDDDLDLYVSIMIDKADGTSVAAFTTDSSISGNIASNGQAWTLWTNATNYGIKSIDHKTGFVDIDGLPLKSTWTATSSYYYDEDRYEFTLVNFNPINNPAALDDKISLFIDPDSISETKSQTLFYLKTDETGKVTESNWDSFDNTTQTLDSSSLPLYYDLYPSGWRPNESHETFIDDYTVEGTGTGDFLVLGDITTAPAVRSAELSLIDSRRRGGGIIDTSIDDATEDNPEVQWYWDQGYWDGTPYPGNASYFVEVPVDIFDGAGGTFLQQEVKNIINNHTAAGVYAVVKAYGIEATVSGISPGAGTIDIEWGGHEY